VDASEDSPAGASAATGDRILRFITRLGPAVRARRTRALGQLPLPDRESLAWLALIALMSALSGTGVLYLLNSESSLVEQRDYSLLTAVGFVVLLIAYRLNQRHLISRASDAIEAALHQWRERIAAKVLRLSLRDVEAVSPGLLLDGMARHYAPLSQSIVTLVAGVESSILLLFMFGYLVFLSPTAALVTLGVGALCVLGYMNVAAQLAQTQQETASLTARLDRLSESSIAGTKELRLNAARRTAVQDDMAQTSAALYRNRARSAGIFAEVISSGNTASYLMAGAVVFVLPLISDTDPDQIAAIVMAVIFLIGPIGGMIGSLQQLSVARFAARSILDFETRVDTLLARQDEAEQPLTLQQFQRLELQGVTYTHSSALDVDSPFQVRDLALELRRGQLLLITGGNGSGKTTALRVLTGLYPRDGGEILVDGQRVPARPGQGYRDLFATVFADFHVFAHPYALDEAGMALLEHWLRELGIRHKLPADLSGGLQPQALSTGQRKRLALAFALAEDRPILVLDEWAADQDPATRRRFYEQILPALQQAGKTLVVVSHDERYFGCADLHLHMDSGHLRPATAADLEDS